MFISFCIITLDKLNLPNWENCISTILYKFPITKRNRSFEQWTIGYKCMVFAIFSAGNLSSIFTQIKSSGVFVGQKNNRLNVTRVDEFDVLSHLFGQILSFSNQHRLCIQFFGHIQAFLILLFIESAGESSPY